MGQLIKKFKTVLDKELFIENFDGECMCDSGALHLPIRSLKREAWKYIDTIYCKNVKILLVVEESV